MHSTLPLHNRTGSEIFDRLFRHEPIATLLESPVNATRSDLTRYSICAGSPQSIDNQPQMFTPGVGQILDCLRGLLATGASQTPTDLPAHLPFTGGWLGWLGYELAWEIERLPDRRTDPLPFPIAYWYAPHAFAILDHWEQILYLSAPTALELANLALKLESDEIESVKIDIAPPALPIDLANLTDLHFFTSADTYQQAILQAQKHIQVGDIFQANLSLRFSTHTDLDSWQIYRRLQQINPSPFASYWQTPWGSMISCSPERLVKYQQQQATTRPIAGTRKRGQSQAIDELLATELATNTKEIAEHIMLVDLERNDLGRVCRWGSVHVDELLSIERYSHVMHLVSNVTGEVDAQFDSIDLISAMFPGGTITGCPKVRCMEIIAELEPLPRNLFYGSCGYLDRRGNLDLNILIRTLLYHKGTVWGQVGAGIVADSQPYQEWRESLQKAAAQIEALGIRL
ncbi:anthranilate synthase component I [Chamaesiphon sp. GL140_3_metabinner_50]|uniref:anthranilate synthase component I n=1 Tax=Chamaesiphon sp. GL140_3_metabinner_50 TaxID=2970812 RepID=UPI0025D8FF4D|nr:anthranilate synthase component I [Chamaesiphon sp. GL140_3_metabinner_50]